MLNIILVGLGGFIGAIARYGLVGLIQKYVNGSFPLGTLVVNLLGCFLLGGLMGLSEKLPFVTQEARVFLAIGFLGSFTTLSTVGYETFSFLRVGDFKMAVINAGANGIVGLLAVAVGWRLMKGFSV